MANAQMEVMGLVIVVILMTLGLLLVVKFVVLKEPSELRTVQTDSQTAANFLNTLLQTSTTCGGTTLGKLVRDCAGAVDMTCQFGTQTLQLCSYVNRTIGLILNRTLLPANRAFNLSFSQLGNAYPKGIAYHRGDCSGALESKSYVLPAPGEDIVVELKLCR